MSVIRHEGHCNGNKSNGENLFFFNVGAGIIGYICMLKEMT